MNPDAHRAVIEDYYRAMGADDFDHVVSLHDPDVVCWMSGRSLVSGRFQGRTELYAHMGEHVLGPLVPGEPYVKGSRIAIVDGDITVGLLHGGLPAKDGGRYDQFYLQIFRFEDGLIREIVEMFDTVMVETRLMKNRLATPRGAPERRFGLDAPAIVSSLSRDAMARLALSFAEKVAAGDFDGLSPLLAGDTEIRVIGSTPLSGRWSDPAVLADLFAERLADVRPIAADGNGAVLLARAAAEDYAQQYGLLIEADGARIGCVSVFFDTVEAEARRFGNPMQPEPSRGIMPDFDIRRAFPSRQS
jgi:ketosteroid isomerase-like protein